MYTEENCPHLRCRDCKFWAVDADILETSACKRVDHKTVKFAKPYFMAYDCDWTYICSDFQPRHPDYVDFKDWTGFEDYLKVWQKVWCPEGDIGLVQVGFTVNGDTSVRYYMPYLQFAMGDMFSGNKLKATTKSYYKMSRQSPTGYVLVTESVDGVEVLGLHRWERE